MKVGDTMNLNVARIRVGSTVREAADILSSTQASDLMVVDDQNRFVGVLSEGDLIRAALPDFDEILAQGGGSLTAGIEMFVDKGRAMANKLIDEYIIRAPLTVRPSEPALRAATLMITKMIRRLPVVEGDQLVGVISRADICRGILRT
jgi:CBS domain-containing protein